MGASGMIGGIIDVDQYVQRDMVIQKFQLNQYKHQEKTQDFLLGVYTNLQATVFPNFQTNYQALIAALKVSYEASSSNPDAVSAEVTGTSIPPVSHEITIANIAVAETQLSMQTFSSSVNPLNISDSFTFTVGAKSSTITVNTGDSLQSIKDNINNDPDNPGILASIVASTSDSGEPQYQLEISSIQTGAANAVSITEGGTYFQMDEQDAGTDANFTFDGLTVTRPTNNVTDVIDGLSFTLYEPIDFQTPATISIVGTNPTTASVTTAVQNLLNGYNQIMSTIDTAQVHKETHNQDFSLIKTQLENVMSGLSGALYNIGIVPSPPQEMKTTIVEVDKTGKEVQKELKYTSDGQWMFNPKTTIGTTILPSLASALSTSLISLQSALTGASSAFSTVSDLLAPQNDGDPADIVNADVQSVSWQKKQIQRTIEDEEARLKLVEFRLRDKYSKLNVTLQHLDEMSRYLTQQMEAQREWKK